MNMNRWIVLVFSVVVGIFILTIGCGVFTIISRPTVELDTTPSKSVRTLDKDSFYIELDRHFAIPVGFGGECNGDFYRVISLREDRLICIVPGDVLKKNQSKFDIFNRDAIIYKVLKELNPAKHTCVMLVRPSAFEFYHRFLKDVLDSGFDFSWFPLDTFQPIVFNLKEGRLGIKR